MSTNLFSHTYILQTGRIREHAVISPLLSYGRSAELVPKTDISDPGYQDYLQKYKNRITRQTSRRRQSAINFLMPGNASARPAKKNVDASIENQQFLTENYTYKRLLLDANKKGYKSIMVCYDTCTLINDYQEKIHRVKENLPREWKILKLGANGGHWPHVDLENATGKGYYSMTSTWKGSFAVGFHHSVYGELYNKLDSLYLPLDEGAITAICKSKVGQCFLCYPNLIINCDGSKWLALISKWKLEMYDESHQVYGTGETVPNKKEPTNADIDVSVVTVCYNRKNLLLDTLSGLEKQYVGKYNFEVVVVDDNSNEDNRLEDIIKNYSFDINLIRITKKEKGDRVNSCVAYNKGFSETKGKIIVIQSPECHHVGDILGHAINNLKEQDYFSYSCFTANDEQITEELLKSQDAHSLVENQVFLEKNSSMANSNWYNHPSKNNELTRYYYCTAIHKAKLSLINGFDSRFAEECGFDKDEFLLTIKYNLKLDIKIIAPDDCFVVHQFHKKSQAIGFQDDANATRLRRLKNKALYEDIKKYHEDKQFNYPKLLFLYWGDTPLSFLNYTTVLSFNKHHKNWKIIVFTPTTATKTLSWETSEHKTSYTGKCYFDKLYGIRNVVIMKIDLDTIGFCNEASEVIKSDYFRYYILEKHGGLWSDFDIIYTANIEDKMNFKEETVIFRCSEKSDIPSMQAYLSKFSYYPIGMLLTNPKRNFFKYLANQALSHYDKRRYQSIGATMLNTLFADSADVYGIDKSVKICDNTYYLPWQCGEIDQFIKRKHNVLPENNIGIHWFNGSDIMKNYQNQLDKRLEHFSIRCYLDQYVSLYLKDKTGTKTEHRTNMRVGLFSESSYPGGGGEEFLLDLADYLGCTKGCEVFWFSCHDWGKPRHTKYLVTKKEYYTEIRLPREIKDKSNFNYLCVEFKKYNINCLFSQGFGHRLICDVGIKLNIPTITIWCFWEEAININSKYGLINIEDNIEQHDKNEDFIYIIENIDYYYFASTYVKNMVELKHQIVLSDEHVFPTLSMNDRFKKDPTIDSYESSYITLLDAHSLKGGVIFAELIKLNPKLSFLAIRTEDEGIGCDAIEKAMKEADNKNNILLYKRVSEIKKVYNKTKILLCPTHLDETFCRVVYEAFINKIPVIFSNKGDLKNIADDRLLRLDSFDVSLYNEAIHKLISSKEHYDAIVDFQYQYYLSIKQDSDYETIYSKFVEVEKTKTKRIGIFTPWCDQGLGIQSRIYKEVLENFGYRIFIFSTKPYIKTDAANLVCDKNEWKTNFIYKSPNKRLEVANLELDLFVERYKIKAMIIPEIQYPRVFEIASYLKTKHNVKTYAIPNIECVQDRELNKFNVFEKILVNNKMSYEVLTRYGLHNIEHIGFYYDITKTINIDPIQPNKQIGQTINILHLSGLNGLIRKRTDIVIDIFEKIYNEGIRNFKLNVVIQGNFDKNTIATFNKPFVNIIEKHLSYAQILNAYNENHVSIQISRQEGLGLGFYESCFMGTPVITLNAEPHNTIIHHNKNGWLLSCCLKKDAKPENHHTIIEQTQIDESVIKEEIKAILSDIPNMNRTISTTKSYLDELHPLEQFRTNILRCFT